MVRRTPLDSKKSTVIAKPNTHSCPFSGNVPLFDMRAVKGGISIITALFHKELAFYFQSTAHCMTTIKTRYKTARIIKPIKI